MDEANENVPLIQCPFCKCCFCSEEDLNAHLKSDYFVVTPRPVNCEPVNERDHLNSFRFIHWKLEHTYDGFE